MTQASQPTLPGSPPLAADSAGVGVSELLAVLRGRSKLLATTTLVGALLGVIAAFVLPPVYTARAVILPPQQQQSSMAAALGSLSALAGLTGGAGGLKSPGDQYVALMQSTTVLDGLIDEFKLQQIYDVKYRVDARKVLLKNSAIAVGKKDNLISIEVDDHEPVRSAAIANAFVTQLRKLTTTLAVSEAQQRRAFFEQQLTDAKTRLTAAQIGLQGSGFNPGAIKAEPKAAAEAYAKLKAEATAVEVRIQTLRRILTDNAPELMQQQAMLSALRGELSRLERTDEAKPAAQGGADYITKYREFKYQETLFDLFARQYELARVDESREGAVIQVVDVATPPEKRSKPKRASLVALGGATGLLVALLLLLLRRRSSA